MFLLGTGLLALLAGAAVLATGGRGERIAALAEGLIPPASDLGFSVATVHLQGASRAAQPEILSAAGVRSGQSILGLDLAGVRARVERVGWVQHAQVIRLLPNTVVIAVKERPLLAVWEHAGRTVVVASNGSVVTEVAPAHFARLPRIVGRGANLAAPALISDLAARPAIGGRLRAAIRVDDRRWDLRMVGGVVVQLPSEGQRESLLRLDALQRREKILDLGLSRIDLRDPEMVIVRPAGQAAPPVLSSGV